MNPNLKKATDKYTLKEGTKNPISKIDAEIIQEIMIALSKLEQTELCDILNGYKKDKDERILDLLLEWNTNFVRIDEVEGDEGVKLTRKFINVGKEDLLIDAWNLKAVNKVEDYNNIRQCFVYQIEIQTKSQVDEDYYKLDFDTKKERDNELKKLYKKLIGCGIKII